MADSASRETLVILDIDGTLVDSNYHHALAWHRALRDVGVTVPVWRIHRSIGMGGDKIVAELAGDDVERRVGDEVRETQGRIFASVIDEVAPLPGAHDAVRAFAAATRGVVLASSARADEAEHYIDLLEIGDVVTGWTSSADVDATKPDPDLVQTACAKGGGAPALMVGDATWDVVAATRAGIPTRCVLTGGFGRDELLGAGAVSVHVGLDELVQECVRNV